MNSRITIDEIKAAARGRWPEILAGIGIPKHYLSKTKHTECPSCGGKDRYRFTDYQQNGGYVCNQCGNGASGFDLIMLVFDYTFSEAARAVAVYLGLTAYDIHEKPSKQRAPMRPIEPPKPERDKQADLIRLWEQAEPISQTSPVYNYLKQRGLTLFHGLPDLRYAEMPYYWQGKSLGIFPCMLAAIRAPDGELQGLHQTYLQPVHENGETIPRYHKLALPDYPDAPAKKMQTRKTGAISGNAVHLFPISSKGQIAVAEGIETALAARELFHNPIPVWACLSAGNLERFEIPPETLELAIIADNDVNQTGQTAADALSIRALNQGITVYCWQPETAGQDALDVLQAKRKKPSENTDGANPKFKHS